MTRKADQVVPGTGKLIGECDSWREKARYHRNQINVLLVIAWALMALASSPAETP